MAIRTPSDPKDEKVEMESSRWRFRPNWEFLTLLAIAILAVVEVLIMLPPVWKPPFMTQWVDQIDSTKLSVLPPALIAVLVAYARWQDQKDAVKYGGFAVVVIAVLVAIRAVAIVNLSTFVLVLFCIVVAGMVGVRHIPLRSRSDWSRTLLYAGLIISAILLLMLETVGSDQTPRYLIWVLLGLFGGAVLISLILFVLDNWRGTLVFGVCLVLVALMLMGLWWIVTLAGLDKSHPVIAEAIVYVALIVGIVLPIAGLMMKGKVRVEPRQS